MGEFVSQSSKYWNKAAEKYEKSPIPDEALYRKTLSEMQNVLSPNMQVLELGCGTGTTSVHIAPYVNKIEAIDISEKMLEIAREKSIKAGIENISFTCGTLIGHNAETDYFDAVLGLHVLHLLPDRQAVVSEIARILKPGGIFVSNTACLGHSYFRFVKPILPLAKLLGLMPEVFFMTEDELANEITKVGLVIENQRHQGMQDIEVFMISRKNDS